MQVIVKKVASLLRYSREAYGRPAVLLAAFGACAALLVTEVAVLWLQYRSDIGRQLEQCEQRTSTAIAHIDRVIAESDRSILAIRNWIESNPTADPLRSAELIRFAESIVVDRRDAAALALISMSGNATILDKAFAGRVIDVSARPYMVAARAAETNKTVFGPLAVNNNTSRRTISMFRAIDVGGRRYAIASAFSVEMVEEFLKSLLDAPGHFVLLLQGSEQVSIVADDALRERFRRAGPAAATDGDVIECSRPLNGTGFVVVAGSTLSSIRAAWLRDNLPTAVLFGMALVLLLTLSIFVAALFGRLWVRDRDLRIALEGAQAADLAKTKFLAVMSHELRTPLNAIVGYSDAMAGGIFGPLPQKYIAYLGHIRSAGQHLIEVVSDILDISRIEAGSRDLFPERLAVRAVVDAAVTMIATRANDRGQRIEVQVPQELPDIHADPTAIRQVVINLLTNATKFSPVGGTIHVDARRLDDGALSIEVRDRGIGIRPEYLESIFRPFWQAEGALERRYEGTGLGLSISQRLMELHQGRIEVESRHGEGSTFRIIVPASRVIEANR